MQLDIPYELENFIGGHFIGPLSGKFISNINPATSATVGQIPDSDEKMLKWL
jgi:acyl-CoA reductase-like NAD-dependent aldehyde dehydrogenase